MHTRLGRAGFWAALFLGIAALLGVSVFCWGNRQYYLTSFLLAGLMLLPFLLRFEGRRPGARELVLLASMAALAVAGRAAFYWLPQAKPVSAIVILTAGILGPEAGFLTGALAALLSNFFFGQGPWTPWQMLGFGLVGFLGGKLFYGKRKSRLGLAVYGFFSVLLVYGGLLDTASLFLFPAEISWQALLALYASGFPFNLVHAVATVVFLWLLDAPVCAKLERLVRKYGIDIKAAPPRAREKAEKP